MNYNKYKIKITLFIIALIFLSASALLTFLNIRKITNYKNGNIVKLEANIENIDYYEYGILKKKYAYTVYSFDYDNKKIVITNMENKISDKNAVNSKTEIYYDKLNEQIVDISVLPNFILAFFFFVFGAAVLIYSIKLDNLYMWSKLN